MKQAAACWRGFSGGRVPPAASEAGVACLGGWSKREPSSWRIQVSLQAGNRGTAESRENTGPSASGASRPTCQGACCVLDALQQMYQTVLL